MGYYQETLGGIDVTLLQGVFGVLNLKSFFFTTESFFSPFSVGVSHIKQWGITRKPSEVESTPLKQWGITRKHSEVLTSQKCIYKIGAQLWKQTWC